MRDFHDNFAAEPWGELGDGAPIATFSLTEIPVTRVVLGGLALLAIHAAILFGALLLLRELAERRAR